MRARAARLHFRLARILGAIGWSRGAAAAYRDAVAALPAWAEAHFEMGDALGRSGDWASAVPAFEQAIRLRPDNDEARGNLVVALEKLERHADAIAALEALARHRPHDAEIHLALGTLYRRVQRHDDAVRAFRWSVRLPPPDKHRRCWLGEALLGPKAWAEVHAAYEHAAALGTPTAAPTPAWHSCLNQHPTETPREFSRVAPKPVAAKAKRRPLTMLGAPFRVVGSAFRSVFSSRRSLRGRRDDAVRTWPPRPPRMRPSHQ
jgi:tetratricopeptide (TPR) repeat protein